MKEREFNQNLNLEHSLAKELEFPNTRDWRQSEDYRDKTLEFEKLEEFQDSDTKSQKKNSFDKKSKKKLMKMMLGTIGAVTIANSAGLFEQSSDYDHDHSKCVYSTEYNELFNEITTLMTAETRALAAERIDSDEMQKWLDEISPSEERSRCSYIYNKKYVTNCPTEVYQTDYDSSTLNLYFIVTVNDGEGYDGELKNDYDVYLTPKLDMTEEYLEYADEIDVAYIGVTNHLKNEVNFHIDMPQEKIDEILIRNNVQEMPPRIQFEKLTITDYSEGKDYQLIRDFIHLSSDERVIYQKEGYAISSDYVKQDAIRNTPLTFKGKFEGHGYEYIIDDSGQVTVAYRTDENGERHIFTPTDSELLTRENYSMLTRTVFLVELQK